MPDAKRHHGDEQGVGAAGDADAMLHADIIGEARFEFSDLRSQDVLAVVQNPVDAAFHFRADHVLLGFEIDEIDPRGGEFESEKIAGRNGLVAGALQVFVFGQDFRVVAQSRDAPSSVGQSQYCRHRGRRHLRRGRPAS